MQLVRNAPLAPLTTFGLGGPAAVLVSAESEAELIETVRSVDARKEPLLIVGGGSNLVIDDAGFPGTAIRVATKGITVGDHVTASAGEVWDDFVTRMTVEGFSGVECLAGIPGLVGAVPMQNVGAYGQDVSETIVRVRAWDRIDQRIVEIDHTGCRFAYRTSAFRGRDRHVILGVTFRLPKSSTSRPIRYAELARALGVEEGASAPLELVRTTIVELRRKKGMVVDPEDRDTASAGSFFTNPILDATALEALRARAGQKLPEFPEPDGRTKVSAAWLIEHAGFTRGYPGEGRARVSTKHALALTNRGEARTADVLTLARKIRDGVRDRFGVTLENEPVFVGVTL